MRGSISEEVNDGKIQISREHLETQVLWIGLWETTSPLDSEHAVHRSFGRIWIFGLAYKTLQTLLYWQPEKDSLHLAVFIVFDIDVDCNCALLEETLYCWKAQRLAMKISNGKPFGRGALQVRDQVRQIAFPDRKNLTRCVWVGLACLINAKAINTVTN